MNITVLELEDDKVRIALPGLGHTFMNVLASEILKDKSVDIASYVIEFQFSDPVLTVTTYDKKDPITPVMEACKRLSASTADLIKQLDEIKK